MLMQFEQMSKMGGMMGFLDKLPGMSNLVFKMRLHKQILKSK
jgi:signal recognition particle GTPase